MLDRLLPPGRARGDLLRVARAAAEALLALSVACCGARSNLGDASTASVANGAGGATSGGTGAGAGPTSAGPGAGGATSAGIGVDAHGNVFINDSGNEVIRRVDTMGTISTVAGTGTPGYNGDGKPATHARLNPQFGVVVDAAGEIFISDTYNLRIRMVDRCGIIHTVAGNGTNQFTVDPGPALDVGVNVPQYAVTPPPST